MSESLRVLIADDESLHNLALTSQLETLGHQVVATAANGREAVELARETQPDLAFLDIRMPTMTGPEAAHEIAADRPIPMIILSAYSDSRTVDEAIKRAGLPLPRQARRSRRPRARHRRGPRPLRRVDGRPPPARHARAAPRGTQDHRARQGLLMESRRLSEREAYRFLQKTSQDKNTPMVELARKILLAAPLLQKE
jgi:two-component system, response regulator PdtaR